MTYRELVQMWLDTVVAVEDLIDAAPAAIDARDGAIVLDAAAALPVLQALPVLSVRWARLTSDNVVQIRVWWSEFEEARGLRWRKRGTEDQSVLVYFLELDRERDL